jgi:hypothetical protein
MGDNYQPEAEFFEYSKYVPQDKLFIKNNDRAVEREKYEGINLWKTGGNESMNQLMDIMKNDGVEICACLDDDDIWYEDHLEKLNIAYTRFPSAVFVHTNGYHVQSGYMPNVDVPFCLNNWPPFECRTLHSATSWNLQKVPLKYADTVSLNIDLNNDGYMWVLMREYFKKHNLDYVYVPHVTVWHDEHKPGCQIDNYLRFK